MAQLVQVVDEYSNTWTSDNGKEHITLTGAKFIIAWHWQLIDTTPAEVAHFNTLGDNE